MLDVFDGCGLVGVFDECNFGCGCRLVGACA